eukprot:TRINITY_DN6361_c0_g1_i1.p1 TRINITY_DN6361_c0_g1~~TRINITY_DN6361_c0_g1_i1.p1  ORF type:complete len:107 (-),score=13.52 TRINITY_DN6361_c0_g1_i1:7-327(-)
MILTPKEDLIGKVKMEDLASYAQNFFEPVPNYIRNNSERLEGVDEIILQFDLLANKKVELKIAVRPSKSVDPQIQADIKEIIKKVPVIDVKGLVQFQLYFLTKNSH